MDGRNKPNEYRNYERPHFLVPYDSTVAHALLISTPVVSRRWSASGRTEMLETIAIILLVLWLLGLVSGYTLGNFIYILLVIAIVLFLVRIVSGRPV
jgi:hypothetical protein